MSEVKAAGRGLTDAECLRAIEDIVGKACDEDVIMSVERLAAKDGSRSGGICLISAERQRQITQEGYTSDHDNEHEHGELAEAAACYALVGKITDQTFIKTFRELPGIAGDYNYGYVRGDFPLFPWDFEWWKPTGDPIRDLTKAGALIAAELDRLLRASPVSAIRDPQ